MFRVRVISSIILCSVFFSVKGQTLSNASTKVRVRSVSINSGKNEFSPMLSNGKLIFTSDNYEFFGAYYSAVDTTAKLSYLYTAQQLDDSTFTVPELLDKRLGKGYNSGPAWMNDSGNHLYFSSNDETSFLITTSKKKSKLQIYFSNHESGNWSERTKLPFCDGKHNDTHPFLNQTEDTLFFASDRNGDYDIFYSVLENEVWSEPVNLGEQVNSDANECFPSYSDSKLIFSSDRAGGNGKLDFYSFRFKNNELLHLDAPFNSEEDDFSLVQVDSKKGYFSSSREGNDQIYFFQELFPDFKDCEPYEKDPFCFTFFEESDDLEEGLDLEYVWSFGDSTSATGKEARHCFAGYGEYLVELNIVDRTTSKVFYNQSTYPFAIERSERLHLEGPDTVPPSQQIIFTGQNSSLEGSTIDHFYWELDEGQLRFSDTNTIALNFETEGTHQLTMGVIASSEGNGEEQWCVTKTITVQKGAQVPPPINQTKIDSWETSVPSSDYQYTLFLGVSDTLIQAASLNNKDSLRIDQIGDSLYMYSMGLSDNKSDLLSDYRMAQEMGFTDSQVTQVKEGELVQMEQLAHSEPVELENILDNRIKKEQILATFDVFYAFDSYELTPENQELIKKVLQNHQFTTNTRILISSFTDLKGKSEYNLKLSKKRSIAVRNELVKNGVAVEQIESEYFGKRVPESMSPLSDAQRRKSLIIIYENN